MIRKYLAEVKIEQDEDGVYIATCATLQGCHAQGESYKEAFDNIVDVIEMCLAERDIRCYTKP